jgi:hypothetical protein
LYQRIRRNKQDDLPRQYFRRQTSVPRQNHPVFFGRLTEQTGVCLGLIVRTIEPDEPQPARQAATVIIADESEFC